jgi:predicted nucleic acid-binding protein
MNYFLDTNALWYLFESIVKSQNLPLETKLQSGGIYSFAISEITAMEIYSVFGSKARGKPAQDNIICTREIKNPTGSSMQCSQKWFQPPVHKLSQNLLRQFHKIINDMEHRRGILQAHVIGIDSSIIQSSRNLLSKYSSQFDFHSLDSLVAASMLKLDASKPWTIVTSDTKFKNILKLEGKLIYDPLKDTSFSSSIPLA